MAIMQTMKVNRFFARIARRSAAAETPWSAWRVVRGEINRRVSVQGPPIKFYRFSFKGCNYFHIKNKRFRSTIEDDGCRSEQVGERKGKEKSEKGPGVSEIEIERAMGKVENLQEKHSVPDL
jgi:hypothetical protein